MKTRIFFLILAATLAATFNGCASVLETFEDVSFPHKPPKHQNYTVTLYCPGEDDKNTAAMGVILTVLKGKGEVSIPEPVAAWWFRKEAMHGGIIEGVWEIYIACENRVHAEYVQSARFPTDCITIERVNPRETFEVCPEESPALKQLRAIEQRKKPMEKPVYSHDPASSLGIEGFLSNTLGRPHDLDALAQVGTLFVALAHHKDPANKARVDRIREIKEEEEEELVAIAGWSWLFRPLIGRLEVALGNQVLSKTMWGFPKYTLYLRTEKICFCVIPDPPPQTRKEAFE